MSRLPFEAFLALRYLRPKRTFVSVITLISITGVMLGVAVLIVVISVMSGFDQEWRDRILGFNAHLKLYQADPSQGRALRDYSGLMEAIRTNSLVSGVAPFIVQRAIVESEPADGHSQTDVPILLGIDPEAERSVSVLPNSIIKGSYDLGGQGLLIGSKLASNLRVNVGDRIMLYSPTRVREMLKEKQKGGEDVKYLGFEYTIKGIFDVGYENYDAMFVVTSLDNAREIYGLPDDTAEGLQIQLHNPLQADRARDELASGCASAYFITTWAEENRDIFNALATEKNMMFFLLFFIMIVAAFGIVNCQITFVVQKTREIGILKALGATQAQVLWIFLSQSVAVGVLGVGLGFSLAMVALRFRNEFLHFMNRVTGFQLLPSSVYQLYELPSSVEKGDILLICVTAFLACVAAGIFPAWKAASLQPVAALRNE